MSGGMSRLREGPRYNEPLPSAAKAGIEDRQVIAALKSVGENFSPFDFAQGKLSGTRVSLQLFPALKRRAIGRRPSGAGSSSRLVVAILCGVVLTLASAGCGYHTTGSKVDLPQNIHTIAIPGFVSHSQTFRIEQLLTDAVVREFNARTQYKVVHDAKGDADAVLKATVVSASANPLAYDSQTGRAVSALVTVSVQVTLIDRQGKVLFDNPAYLFHDQYELSRDLPSFFQEDSPAVDRLSRDFARTLVANILEAY
jgi:outer membrane lipopolysaccharide assembly protein LptE/RlpB